MFEKLLEVLLRIAAALEKLAAGGTAVSDSAKPEKPKKEKGEKAADPKPETKETEKPKSNPFGDDDDAPAPQRTKEEVRKLLTEYANATNNDTALEALAKATSNKAGRVPDIKPEEYGKVYDAIAPLLAATKK